MEIIVSAVLVALLIAVFAIAGYVSYVIWKDTEADQEWQRYEKQFFAQADRDMHEYERKSMLHKIRTRHLVKKPYKTPPRRRVEA